MRAIPLIGLLLLASPAAAEVVSAGPNGFHVRQSVQIVVPTDRAYSGFGSVASWWNKDHTYSGDSANLSVSVPQAVSRRSTQKEVWADVSRIPVVQ